MDIVQIAVGILVIGVVLYIMGNLLLNLYKKYRTIKRGDKK